MSMETLLRQIKEESQMLGSSHLVDHDVRVILKWYREDGHTMKSIADMFQVDRRTISNIVRCKTKVWQYIYDELGYK